MCRPNIGYITLIVNRKLTKKGGGNSVPRATVEYPRRVSMAVTQYTLSLGSVNK